MLFTLQGAAKLMIQDLAAFAKYAYKKTWYDVTIQFLRTVFAVIPTLPKADRPTKAEYKELVQMRKNVIQFNNQWLLKHLTLADRDFKVLPYVVNDKLERKKKQPKVLRENNIIYAKTASQQGKEHFFRSVCNGFSFKRQAGIQYVGKCGYLHHFDPYLKLGPYHYEMASHEPMVMVIHDLFSKLEMDYLVETSKPNLSRTRGKDKNNDGYKHEFKGGKRRRIVHKTVQHWLDDVKYEQLLSEPDELDTNWNYTLESEVLFKLTRRLEIATTLKISGKYGSTSYQTTNYGLGGLCETHIDPHGYLEGTELPPNRQLLKRSGDMIATIMGWIEEAPVGGATAFIHPYHEVTVWPTKGSAAFWFSLDRRGYRDKQTVHGGCPVIQGSKWILNKWVYYFDQVDRYPCTLNVADKHQAFTGVY